MLGAMSHWVYNRNPTESLHFEGPLKELKEDLASGNKVSSRSGTHASKREGRDVPVRTRPSARHVTMCSSA